MPRFHVPQPKKWKVCINDLNLAPIELNGKGIKLSVYDDDDYLGELILKSTGVIWRTAKDKRMSEKSFAWINFIKLMEGHRKKDKVMIPK